MRYWVYINDKVEGPFTEEKLVTLQGFTPDTLICSEDTANSGNQEWVKASSVFEFDQVASAANASSQTQGVGTAAGTAAATDELAALLLSKLDALTSQISGLQEKLEGMQTKLDEAISSSSHKSNLLDVGGAPIPLDDSHANTITLTRHDIEAQVEEVLPPTTEENQPLDMLGPVELGEDIDSDSDSKVEEDVVVSSALDSIYNAKLQSQQDINENTFQDLLTPKQAAELAAQADAAAAENDARERTLDEALKQVEQSTPNSEEKDKLLDSFSTSSQSDIVDQVIQEKEEEKSSSSAAVAGLAAAAGVAALAGAAAFAADTKEEKEEEQKQKQEQEKEDDQSEVNATSEIELEDKKESEPKTEPEPKIELEEKAETLETSESVEEKEKQPIDLSQTDGNELPSLPVSSEETQPDSVQEQTPNVLEDEQPQQAPVQAPIPAPIAEIPTLESAEQQQSSPELADEKTKGTIQELVPGSTVEDQSSVIITEEDLQEAFAERDSHQDQSVEQLFGLAGVGAGNTADAENADAKQDKHQEEHLETLSVDNETPVAGKTTAQTVTAAPANPNDLTEIELKEGSTYLISDFVPPADTSGNALPKELAGLERKTPDENDTSATPTVKEETEVQEMVSLKTQTQKQVPAPKSAPGDVTVSQVLLENTIKTKRGASLDIKTVPMVNEPGQSERLHLEGLDDDLNTQHDLQKADEKTAGKTTKIVVGALLATLLFSVLYLVLGFLQLIPSSLNIFSSDKKAAQSSKQSAQLEEMLNSQEYDDYEEEEAMDPESRMDIALDEVKNYALVNGYTLKEFIDAKHPAVQGLITWEISTAVDPDNYSILVKVPPENPQSFKISYRFNYNAVTRSLEPTISDAKNLLDSANQGAPVPDQPAE